MDLLSEHGGCLSQLKDDTLAPKHLTSMTLLKGIAGSQILFCI